MYVCMYVRTYVRTYAHTYLCVASRVFVVVVVVVVTCWTIGVIRIDSRRGLGIFLFTTASGMALGPTQPPI